MGDVQVQRCQEEQDDTFLVVTKLFNELGPRYKNRPGGYLRILKCGFRSGDSAPMAIVELVDRPLEDAVADTIEEVSAADA